MHKFASQRITFFIVLVAFAGFIGFGFFHLSKFETVDEHFWKFERIGQYWKEGILAHNLKKTYINDKPGVTVALLSGIGLLFEPDPEALRIRDPEITQDDLYTIYDITRTEKINFSLRTPILLFNGLFLFFFYWIIKKMTNHEWIAAFSVLFMAFSPVLIGISQIINPDSLLWTFSAAAIFSYLALLKTGDKKLIALTALFTGLSLLSKYTAMILFPVYLLLFLGYLSFHFSDIDNKKSGTANFVKRNVLYFFLVISGSLIVFSLLLPAVFVKAKYFWRGTIGFDGFAPLRLPILVLIGALLADAWILKSRIISALMRFICRHRNKLLRITVLVMLLATAVIILNCWLNQGFIAFDELRKDSYLNEETIRESSLISDSAPLQIAKLILTQAYPFVFSVTPIVLLAVIGLWIKVILNKKSRFPFLIFFLSFMPLLIFAGYLISEVRTTIRYSIMLYPLFALLAALGIFEMADLLKKFLRRNFLFPALAALIVISSIVSLWGIKPFYFNYTNDLLPKKFTIADAWGYGSYEAAQYLNSLPNAENLIIWSDWSTVCQFVKGKCIGSYKIDLTKTVPDYFVISRRGADRRKFNWKDYRLATKTNLDYYNDNLVNNFEWALFIGDRPENFVKIIKSEEKKR